MLVLHQEWDALGVCRCRLRYSLIDLLKSVKLCLVYCLLTVEHHVFLRKVRVLLRFRNLIRSLFLDNASSEIKLICKKYSANVNNIYTCIRRSAFGTWLRSGLPLSSWNSAGVPCWEPAPDIWRRHIRRRLRSADSAMLVVPSTRRSTLGDCTFPVASARAWNSLPSYVRNAPSLTTFLRELKTVLFRSSFDND